MQFLTGPRRSARERHVARCRGDHRVLNAGPGCAAVSTAGYVAGDEDEAFDSVKSMIMRRANKVALVAVEDVERIDATRLADW